jgi:hypothetical protein
VGDSGDPEATPSGPIHLGHQPDDPCNNIAMACWIREGEARGGSGRSGGCRVLQPVKLYGEAAAVIERRWARSDRMKDCAWRRGERVRVCE